MTGGIFGYLGDALFGASPYVPTQRAGVGGGITPTPPGAPGYSPQSSLGGLLDPRGIREQAFYQGLGSLSQGLLAAGLPHPAAQGSLIPQALGAFQPAYSGALSQGYQQANAELQMRQQQQDEQYLQAYRQANPAYANLPRAALIAQISRTPPTGFEPDPTRPGAMRPIVGGPEDLTYRGARSAAERDPLIPVDGQLYNRAALLGGGGAASTMPAPGGAPAPAPAAGGAPPGGTQSPVGIRNNNWVSMTVPGTGGRQLQQYDTPEVGIAAASQNLDRLFPSGTVTPRQLVQMWAQGPNYNAQTAAPGIRASVENYGTAVARAAGASSPDQPINLQDPATRQRVIEAMGQFETGGLPQGSTAVVARGIALASQPGASFRPVTPRQVAQGGGAASAAPPTPPATPSAAPGAPEPAAAPDWRTANQAAPVLPAPPPGAQLVLQQPRGAILPGPTQNQITAASSYSERFLAQPEVRNALRTRNVLTAMEGAAGRNTAASDLDLIYGVATILDPNSVVRGPEGDMVRQTQDIPNQIMGYIRQRLEGGTALSPEARAAIMETARSRVAAQMESYNSLHGRQSTLVQASNLNPDVVLGTPLTMPTPWVPPRAPTQPPPPATSAATPAGPAQPGAGPGGTGMPAPPPQPAPPPPPPAPPAAGAAGRRDTIPPPPLPTAQQIDMMGPNQAAELRALSTRVGEMSAEQRAAAQRAAERILAAQRRPQ